MAKNGNRAKRNCHTGFLAFYNFHFKIAPIDALNSAQGNQTHFFKKAGYGT